MPDRWILQIVLATGWQAVYAIRPECNDGRAVCVTPLACWALVQHEAVRSVVGLDSTMSFCDQGDNFLGYLGPGEDRMQWEQAARLYLQGEVTCPVLFPQDDFASPSQSWYQVIQSLTELAHTAAQLPET
jgi:hypothetical protein